MFSEAGQKVEHYLVERGDAFFSFRQNKKSKKMCRHLLQHNEIGAYYNPCIAFNLGLCSSTSFLIYGDAGI